MKPGRHSARATPHAPAPPASVMALRLVAVASVAWAAWGVGHLGVAGGAWREVGAHARGLTWDAVRPPGLPAVAASAGRQLWVAAVTIAFLLGAAAAGGRMERWWGARGSGRWEALALRLLLGLPGLGLWMFGLGLAGLYVPLLLWGSVALGAAVGVWRTLPAGTGPRPSRWMWLGLAPLAPTVVTWSVPDHHVDALGYHLAAPEFFLRLHRCIFWDVPISWHLTLTSELLSGLGIAIHQDMLARGVQFGSGAALLVLLGGWAARQGPSEAGWLTAVLAGTCGVLGQDLGASKNDVLAAALPVAGALAIVRGLERRSRRWLLLGAWLLGCAAAVKLPAWVWLGLGGGLVVLGWRGPARWKLAAAWAAVALLPALPWAVKAFLTTGDPVYPVLAPRLPWALWDAHDTAAQAIVRQTSHPGEVLAGLLPRFLAWWQLYQPVVGWGLPVGLGAAWSVASCRRLTVFGMSGFVLISLFLVTDADRYALAGMLLVTAVAAVGGARAARRLPRWGRLGLLTAVMAGGWVPLPQSLVFLRFEEGLGYLTGRLDREALEQRTMTTYHEAGQALAREHARGVLEIGDMRPYGLDMRCHAERMVGRGPAWVLAKECATTERIRIRFRQNDFRHVLYNFVTEIYPHPVTQAFPWDDRMLAVWADFVGRYLDVAVAPAHVDHHHGGYCLYRVRPAPRTSPPAFLPYLPGIAQRYFVVTSNAMRGDMAGWTRDALALLAQVPRVDQISNLVGEGYMDLHAYAQAYAFYEPGVRHGQVDDGNVYNFALAAAMLGKFSEAERWLPRAVAISPDSAPNAAALREQIRNARGARPR